MPLMDETRLEPQPAIDISTWSTETETASAAFIGRWHQLVSTTNWEKGRIIQQWRDAVADQGCPVTDYSDEAWAKRVGGVTGQHVGRLRRVFQRFGATYETYNGLFWSHFQAAVEWEDAELWLEGGVQNKWSVSQMRKQRWESIGAPADKKPRDEDIIVSELNEDIDHELSEDPTPHAREGGIEGVSGPRHDGADFGDEEGNGSSRDPAIYSEAGAEQCDFVRPFEHLSELPDDLADAFENFKLAVLAHKANGWADISCEDVLASLDALKALAVAPTGDAPF
jgi:hypothetical protein